MRYVLAIVGLSLLAAPAVAEDAEAAPAAEQKDVRAEQAKAFLKQYLDALVKAAEGKKPQPGQVSQKLAGTKKFIHPKSLEQIGQQERNKVVTLPLATWHFAKADYWLKEYEIEDVKAAAKGTYVVEVKERNWRVEEGGEDGEFEPNSYLLAQFDGKWLLIDKRRNSSFTDDAIKIGYKQYFAAPKAEAKPKEAEEPKPEE